MLELVKLYAKSSRDKVSEIKGLIFNGRDKQQAFVKDRWLVENLEDYPYMDYDIFDLEGDTRLQQKHLGVLSPAGIFSLPLITGRGCPYKCTYCSNSALIDFYGGTNKFVRRYSPGSAISNIKTLVDKHRPRFLEFFDETFTLGKNWIKDFCNHYKKEIAIPYVIMSRIDTIDEDMLSILSDSGLKLFMLGVECGDEEYRTKYLNRKMSDKTIIEGTRLLKKYGIMVVTFNIFGMPFETKNTVNKTFAINEEIEPDAAIPFIYQPFSNTELGRIAYKNKMAPPPHEGRWDFCSPSLDTAKLPAQYVLEMSEKFREKYSYQNIQVVYDKLRKIASSSK